MCSCCFMPNACSNCFTKAPVKWGPRFESIILGVPNLQITSAHDFLAVTSAVWVHIGNASTHLLKESIMPSRYWFPLGVQESLSMKSFWILCHGPRTCWWGRGPGSLGLAPSPAQRRQFCTRSFTCFCYPQSACNLLHPGHGSIL